MSQWLLRGCALASLFVCTFPVAAMAGEKLAAAPYAVIGAGSDLVALSADQQLWRRDNRDGADWLAVAPLPGEAGFKTAALTCAADHSGVCIVTVGDGRISHLDLFQAGKGMVRTLTLNDADIEAMPDKNSAFIGRARRDGGRDIYRYNLGDGSDVRIGTVQADESAVYVMVEGKLTPVARKGFGDFREVSDLADPPGFHLPDYENLIWTPEGALVREPWAHNPPIQADVRGIADIRFVRGEKDGHASLQPKGGWFIAFPVSGPIPESYNGAADANNDVVLEMIGPEKDMLGVLCQSDHGPIVQYIADIQHDEMTHISASASATGFVLTTTGLSFTPLIQTLRLSPSPVPGGWRTRPCAATTATISSADVVSRMDDDISLATGEAVSRDGTKLSYTLLTPKGVTPEHVIIDVYGAYGRRRDYSAYNAQTKQVLIDTKTAIAFPLIRGDGDKGFGWAMASATPHRQVAVEDVIAVAQSLRAHYPEVKGVTVRGQSAADGWRSRQPCSGPICSPGLSAIPAPI
jgi:hypothetical protein